MFIDFIGFIVLGIWEDYIFIVFIGKLYEMIYVQFKVWFGKKKIFIIQWIIIIVINDDEVIKI